MMSTHDAKRIRASVCWLLPLVCGLGAGCGGADPATNEAPMSMTDAASSPVSSAASADASLAQAGLSEAGTLEAGALEAGMLDAGTLDAGTLDATAPEAGTPAAVSNDSGPTSPQLDASTSQRDGATGSDASTPPVDAGTDASSGLADAGAAHVVHVDSKAEWSASAFRVEAGRCYLIKAKIDDRWLDLDVPANLGGWVDQKDLRIALFAVARRVGQDDIGFYEFATCVDRKLDQCFPIGESSSICPRVSGELFFFVNDVPGFESNNVGTATVTIQAK